MADEKNFQKILFEELYFYFKPLIDTEGDPAKVALFFESIGIDAESMFGSAGNAAFYTSLQNIIGTFSNIENVINDPPDSFKEVIDSITNLKTIFDSLKNLKNNLPNNISDIENFSAILLNKLLTIYIREKSDLIYDLLRFLDILSYKDGQKVLVNNAGILVYNPYAIPEFNSDKLFDYFSDPLGTLKNDFDKGFDDLDAVNETAIRIFEPLQFLLGAMDIETKIGMHSLITSLSADENKRLKGIMTFSYKFQVPNTGVSAEAGGSIGLLPETEGGPGAYIVPFGELTFQKDISDWKIISTVDGQIEGFQITKDGFEIYDNNIGTFEFNILIERLNNDSSAFVIGSKTGTRLEIGEIKFLLGIALSGSRKETFVKAILNKCSLVIASGDGDSFLSKIFNGNNLKADFNVAVGFNNLTGLYFDGSSGIEILLPVHIQLGPIDIQNILISVKPDNKIIPVEISTVFKAELGPIKVVLENVGIKSSFSFPEDRNGNLGPVDLSLGFKPPNGVGISIEAGIVSGGGYLFIDNEKGEYAGILQLTIQGLVSLTAIGLITTKLPDGTPGFSMLIIITAEFMPPFQLSYGFTLMGVGGLLGVNRIVLLDPLRNGVRTGGINSIMFPTDVIANAPRIISDLKAIFPATEGYFLIGPMAKIGWGTPTLISLALGIIIQLPDPKIAILGVLKIVLPTEDAEVLKLQVNFLGTIDPSNQLITFDASLFESNILHTMTLTGDMAVRLKWGEKPDFIMSAGGFHPEYNPTMPVPSLSRIGITVLDLDNARIRVQTYFALTSNTVQFGARADCYFGIDDFSVTGYLGFDALMQFSPFTFKATCSGRFELKTSLGDASVYISALIKGPSPWYVNTTGSIKVFGIEFEASFEKEWGQSKSDILPNISIKPLFLEEMKKAEVWHAELPEGKLQMVSLSSPILDEGTPAPILRIHPFGSVVISQKMLPFNFRMDKFGNQKITDVKKISIESVKAGTNSSRLSPVKDNFAVSQFKNMSDGEKISNPSFEKFECGVKATFGSNNTDFNMGGSVRRSLEYDEIFVDKAPKKSQNRFIHEKADFKNLLKHSSVSKSKLSVQHKNNLGMVNKKINVSEDNLKYTIANTTDNKPIQADMGFDTIADALNSLSGILTKNPALKGNLILIEKE